jgi:hypothetical protein
MPFGTLFQESRSKGRSSGSFGNDRVGMDQRALEAKALRHAKDVYRLRPLARIARRNLPVLSMKKAGNSDCLVPKKMSFAAISSGKM